MIPADFGVFRLAFLQIREIIGLRPGERNPGMSSAVDAAHNSPGIEDDGREFLCYE